MKSLYKRQLMMMVGIVALSFTLLSTAFMLLSYRYILTEKREAMQRNAGYIANFTASNYQLFLNVRNEVYLDYVASIALISDSYVIMANPDGTIIYATDGRNFYEYPDAVIPAEVVNQVLEEGSYSGITNLNGIYPERCA